MKTCTLSIKNLSCQYQQQEILSSLSLQVRKGEIVCLLGASGCGKTTLLKAISGLLPLTDGQISLYGQVLDNGQVSCPPEKRNMGMIFQDYALFPHITVEENIGFALNDMPKAERHIRVQEMLELVKLADYSQRYPHQLSGGQQQRVAIARSLAYKPDLLLLDEPFSNIDTQVRHQLILQIRALFKSQGVTAIFVTHSREEAFAFADKMAVMNNGVIEQYGEAQDLYQYPSSQFVADFLGESSYLPAEKIADDKFKTQLGIVSASSQNADCCKKTVLVGDRCELLLRPHQVSISKKTSGEAIVNKQQFMGDHFRYHIQLNDITLLAKSTENLDLAERVSVSINSDNLVAFAL